MASEYFTTAETRKKQKSFTPGVDLRGKDAPKSEDYIKTGKTLAAGIQGGVQGALAGSQAGPMGALVGGVVGFIGGAIGAENAQQMSFQQTLDSYKFRKDSEKLAAQTLKQEQRAQKRTKEAKKREPGLTAIADIDRDIMNFTPGAGTSQFDQFMGSRYGVG